jgi:acyl-CoA thioesterase-1
MRVILSLLLFVVGLIPLSINAQSSSTENSPDQGLPVLLIMGDSLSAGYGMDREDSWVHLLELRLQEQDHAYRILNSSITGDTTQGGLARLPRLLKRYKPEIVILELGGNDGLRGVNPDVSRANMTSMIEQSQSAGATVLLAGIKLPPNYGPEYLHRFESMYGDLALEYQTLLVPFFMDGVVFVPGMLQDDGIHANENGQPVLLENVWKVLEPALK